LEEKFHTFEFLLAKRRGKLRMAEMRCAIASDVPQLKAVEGSLSAGESALHTYSPQDPHHKKLRPRDVRNELDTESMKHFQELGFQEFNQVKQDEFVENSRYNYKGDSKQNSWLLASGKLRLFGMRKDTNAEVFVFINDRFPPSDLDNRQI
jgi:hypothetical protein